MFLLLIGLSYLLGCVSTFALLLYLYTRYVLYTPKLAAEQHNEQFETFIPIPEDKKAKNSAVDAVNYLFQFLFQELKDSSRLRRYMMHKLNTEFNELKNSRTGKIFVQNIVIDSFSFGQQCPVFSDIRLKSQERDELNRIKGFVAEIDADYQDGFSVGLDITLVFGHKCQVEIKTKRIQGRLRMEFRREPFCHWLFVFQDEPIVDFEVKSCFATVESPQLANIITSQLRRAIKRKQTWPSYKIRYKPFFPTSKQPKPTKLQSASGVNLIPGNFDVTIKYCDRLSMPLMIIGKDKTNPVHVFLTVNINEKSCKDILYIERDQWPRKEIEIQKNFHKLIIKEVPYMDRTEILVQDIEPLPKAIAEQTDFHTALSTKNVFLLKVQGQEVTTLKQAHRLLKSKAVGLPIDASPTSTSPGNEEKIYITVGVPLLYSVQSPYFVEIETNDTNEVDDSAHSNLHREDSMLSALGGVRHRNSIASNESLSPSSQRLQRLLLSGIDENKSLSSSTPKKDNDGDNISQKDGTSENSFPLTTDQNVNKKPKQTKVSSNEVTLMMMNASSLVTFHAQATQKQKFEPHIEVNQEFSFVADEKQEYLNICLWCKVPLQVESPNRGKTLLLIGYASTALSELVLDAHMSFKRETQMTLNFCSPFSPKPNPNAFLTDIESKKRHELNNHKAFDDDLAHGFVTINVRHHPALEKRMTQEEKRHQYLVTAPSLIDLCKNMKEREKIDEQKRYIEVIDEQHAREPRNLKLTEHIFEDKSFTVATLCAACGKKIWMKAGRRCRECHVSIHRKCEEKFVNGSCYSRDSIEQKNNLQDEEMKFVDIDSTNMESPGMAEPMESAANKSNIELTPVKPRVDITQTKPNVDPTQTKPIVDSTPIKVNAEPTQTSSFQRGFPSTNAAARIGTKAVLAITSFDPKARLSFRGFGNKNSNSENLKTEQSSNVNENTPTEKRSPIPSTTNPQPSKIISAASSAYSKLKGFKTQRFTTNQNDQSSIKKLSYPAEQKPAPNISGSDFCQAVSNFLTTDEDIKDLEHLLHGSENDEMNDSAKFDELGREFYQEFSLDERKEKLQSKIDRLQEDIQLQCQIRDEISHEIEHNTTDENEKRKLRDKVDNLNQKIQALGSLLICYCSGMKNCSNEIGARDAANKSTNSNVKFTNCDDEEIDFDDPLTEPIDNGTEDEEDEEENDPDRDIE